MLFDTLEMVESVCKWCRLGDGSRGICIRGATAMGRGGGAVSVEIRTAVGVMR